MCGRYSLKLDNNFYQQFNLVNRLSSFPQNIEVAPGQTEPVITHQENQNFVWLMKWGMIPFWAREKQIGNKMFNVRAESVTTKIGFRKSFQTKRCLVPSNCFYEWKTDNGKKIPYKITVKNRPLFAFAGIYDVWQQPVSGLEIYSYAIITTEPNSIIKPIHNRMPVILLPEQEKTWLDQSTEKSTLTSLICPSSETLIINQY